MAMVEFHTGCVAMGMTSPEAHVSVSVNIVRGLSRLHIHTSYFIIGVNV